MAGKVRKHAGRHGVLAILTLVIIIHAADRLAIGILLEDIKRELLLTDAQLGFLSGFAFVVLYVAVGVPMAFLSDRSNRSRLIGLGLVALGGMTALCGLAQNFVQLAAARCGVGIGASPCVPAAHSIIADMYPPHHRTTALSVVECGFFVGALTGLWACGVIATHYGWRTAFVVIGMVPVFLGIAVMAFMRDPERAPRSERQSLSFRDSLATILGVASVRWYMMGGALAVFSGAAMVTWLPTLMIRSYGMTRSEAGGLIGAMNGIGGIVATIFIGILADRLSHRDNRWNLWIPAILFGVGAPFAAIAFMSNSPAVMLVCFAVAASFIYACSAPIISYTQQIMPSNVHAMITALFFLAWNLLGFGLAPLAVGSLSDWLGAVNGEEEALQHALLYLAAPSLILASAFVAIGAVCSTNGRLVGNAASVP